MKKDNGNKSMEGDKYIVKDGKFSENQSINKTRKAKFNKNSDTISSSSRDHQNFTRKKEPGGRFQKNTYQSDQMNEISDPRFSHVATDPRYQDAPQEDLKIKLDSRFKRALTDKNFISKGLLDPRGRPKNYGTKETLDKFYELEQSSDDDSEEEEGEESSTSEEEDEKNKELKKCGETKEEFFQCLLDPDKDLARGDQYFSDDSSDDDSSTSEEDEGVFGEFDWGEWDKDAQWDVDGVEVEETKRFAVCDMDWDRIKAVDLMVLFSSFCSSSGEVKKVTIYPSEFGKTRIEEEEECGPQELVRLAAGKKKGKEVDEFENLEKIKKGTLNETSEVTSIHNEALRRYQRNRLRYYYAVVECDSVDTARSIYKECDRSHFDVVGVTLDLRYIPSNMEFDEVPHDECSEVPSSYVSEKAPSMALQEAKPTLTWDETDLRRKRTLATVMSKALKKQEFDQHVIKDYIGDSDDSDSDDNEEDEIHSTDEEDAESVDRIAKFRSLISEIDEKERKKESFWNANDALEMESARKESEDDDDSEIDSDDNEDDNEKLTPFEEYLVKRKVKRKEKIKSRKMKFDKLEGAEDNDGEIDVGRSDNDHGERCDNDDGTPSKNVSSSTQNDASSNISQKKKNKFNKSKKQIECSSGQAKSKEHLSLLIMDEETEDKKHFDMRKIREEEQQKQRNKKRRKNETTERDLDTANNFQVDWSDPRFSALFTSGKFHMDPSHPKFDPSISMVNSDHQKPNKKKKISDMKNEKRSNSPLGSEVSNLVSRIKMKTSKLKFK